MGTASYTTHKPRGQTSLSSHNMPRDIPEACTGASLLDDEKWLREKNTKQCDQEIERERKEDVGGGGGGEENRRTYESRRQGERDGH